jgi:hypothetical protein
MAKPEILLVLLMQWIILMNGLKYCDPDSAEAFRYNEIIAELASGKTIVDSDTL